MINAVANQTGVFVNRNGHHSAVRILSLVEKTDRYPGGGNPFSVDSVEVEIEFDSPCDASGSSIWKGLGFPRDGYIGFYTDGDISSRLIVTTINQTE